jgi:ABC-2 type transport system permease protein
MLWLLRHEMRLSWRTLKGSRRGRWRTMSFGVAAVVLFLAGFPLALALRGANLPISPLSILAADLAMLLIFSLMLSQTLAGAAEALYVRGDLDLLFSSPLDPGRTLTVRFLAMAANVFSAFALLALPFLVPFAILGHWRWLGLLGVLAALALAASGAGLTLAVGLFALIGPRRTRVAAQLLAAVIGAAFFLASQTRNLLGGQRSSSLWAAIVRAAEAPRLRLPAAASWPLRAALGEAGPLAALIGAGLALFALVTFWLSRRFAADAAAAQGADTVGARTSRRTPGAFSGGAFAATFVKEERLIVRDTALLGQVLLRVLYMLPATFLLLRGAAAGQSLFLPGGAAAVAFLSGQVAGSLTWITLSAEDAPELIACAPASPLTVRRAKLAAALAPIGALLAPPLAVITVYSPLTGLAATLGAAAAAVSAGLINAWRPSPGKRSEFRRRRSGSLLVGLSLFVVTGLIAASTALLAAGTAWALAPAAVAALALILMRRSPEKIAEALAAER